MGNGRTDGNGQALGDDRPGEWTRVSRLHEIATRPHRNPELHWSAFVASLVSIAMLAIWMAAGGGQIASAWFWADIALGVLFAAEFFTRSGFRWDPLGYTLTRFFDFIAMAPALALVNHGFPGQEVWLWIILVARGVRSIDRALGDGFIQRNALALLEGFEEEITDRVLERILERTQADLDRGEFGRRLSEALARNKESVLQRIKATHPTTGLGAGFAHVVGLEHIEAHTYDAIIEVMSGPEVDRAIRDMVNSTFLEVRAQMAAKTWKQHLGIKR